MPLLHFQTAHTYVRRCLYEVTWVFPWWGVPHNIMRKYSELMHTHNTLNTSHTHRLTRSCKWISFRNLWHPVVHQRPCPHHIAAYWQQEYWIGTGPAQKNCHRVVSASTTSQELSPRAETSWLHCTTQVWKDVTRTILYNSSVIIQTESLMLLLNEACRNT